MILLAVVLVVFGLIKRQGRRYWGFAAVAMGVHSLAGFLFGGGGTLEDPSGDGLVTRVVRRATDDGPAVALVVIPVIFLAWIAPFWIAKRGYRPRQKAMAAGAVPVGKE